VHWTLKCTVTQSFCLRMLFPSKTRRVLHSVRIFKCIFFCFIHCIWFRSVSSFRSLFISYFRLFQFERETFFAATFNSYFIFLFIDDFWWHYCTIWFYSYCWFNIADINYTQWPQYGRYGYLWYGIDPWFMANVFDGKQGPTESRYILKSKRRDSRHFRVIWQLILPLFVFVFMSSVCYNHVFSVCK